MTTRVFFTVLLLMCASRVRAETVDAIPRPIEVPDAGVVDANALDASVDASVDAAVDASVVADAGNADVDAFFVTANIAPDPVKFGATFDLVITVVRDRGMMLTIPKDLPEVEALARHGDVRRSVEDIKSDILDGGTKQARVREVIRIPFMVLGLEDVKTPAFVLVAKDGTQVEVEALPVRVNDDATLLQVPDAGPSDEKQQMALEGSAPVVAYQVADHRPYYALLIVVVLGLLFWAYRRFAAYRREQQKAAPPPPPPPPRPAHLVALERLDALMRSGLLERQETASFVERLMDEVLRDYLENRFTLNAGTRTTRELVKELLSVSVQGLDISLVEQLLSDADLVKFAKASIASERAHAMASRVRALIESTKVTTTEPRA